MRRFMFLAVTLVFATFFMFATADKADAQWGNCCGVSSDYYAPAPVYRARVVRHVGYAPACAPAVYSTSDWAQPVLTQPMYNYSRCSTCYYTPRRFFVRRRCC